MPRIHVLTASGNDLYQVVVHATMPVGNNAAGVSWANAVSNSGKAITIMVEGNGPGQITTAEKNNIQNGTLIEGVAIFQDNPLLTPAQRLAYLDDVASSTIADTIARLQTELKYFGLTRA